MANITDKIIAIRNAIFGKDIRETIASGIESLNTEVVSTTGRQTVLENQFTDVIVNATATDPSSVEIVAARMGETSLPVKVAKIDSELADIATDVSDNLIKITKNEQEITNMANKAIFTIILDDVFKGDFLNAKPSLATYGWVFNSAISPQRLWRDRNNGQCESRLAPYLRYQKENNMSVIAHGLSHADLRNVVNENLVINEILGGKQALEEIGFKVCGFVPPFSTVHANYAHYIKENFSYGFNAFRSNITTMQNAGYKCYQTKSDDYFKLFRISLDDAVNSLQEIKDLIDLAILNKGFICFYDHNIGNVGLAGTNCSVEKFAAILAHINTYYLTGECDVLPCDEAVARYFGINLNYKNKAITNNNNLCVDFTHNTASGTTAKDIWYIPATFSVINAKKIKLSVAGAIAANTEYQIYSNVDITNVDLTDIKNHINVKINGKVETTTSTQDIQLSIEGRYLTSNTGSTELFKMWYENGTYDIKSFPVNPVDDGVLIVRAIFKIKVLAAITGLDVVLENPLVSVNSNYNYKVVTV